MSVMVDHSATLFFSISKTLGPAVLSALLGDCYDTLVQNQLIDQSELRQTGVTDFYRFSSANTY